MSDFVHPRSVNRERHLATSRREVGKPHIEFTHVRRHPDVLENEIRVEWPLDANWVRVYRLVAERGRPVIAEMRLVPNGSRQSVPAGGITHDKSRHFHTDRVLQAVQDYLERREGKFGPGDRAFIDRVLLRFELEPQKVIGDVITSRQRREIEIVARAAAAYAGAPLGNRRRAVADAVCYSVWGADKLIRDAKSRGFLADDGQLTDRAREVLKSVELAAVA